MYVSKFKFQAVSNALQIIEKIFKYFCADFTKSKLVLTLKLSSFQFYSNFNDINLYLKQLTNEDKNLMLGNLFFKYFFL